MMVKTPVKATDAAGDPGPGLGPSPVGPEEFHPIWKDPTPLGPEDDLALARMLGWAMLVGIALWIVLAVALL